MKQILLLEILNRDVEPFKEVVEVVEDVVVEGAKYEVISLKMM